MKEKFIGLPKENIIEITTVDENTVIEGKHLMLFAEYLVEASLTLKDCFIEICGGGFMGAGGTLVIEDCEIKDPISRLISRDFKEVTVKDTSIFWEDMFPCLRMVDSESEITFKDCSFENPNLPQRDEEGEDDGEVCDIPVLKMPEARLSGCSFRGFPSMNLMTVSELVDCTFFGCGVITVTPDQDEEDERKISGCEFSDILRLSVLDCKITDCTFKSCNVGAGSVITSDSDISGCKFEDISLSDNAYIGSLSGSARVFDCSFESIKGEKDGAFFTATKRAGFLGLKKVTYDPVDRSSCKGL